MKWQHRFLLDAVAQHGPPSLFLTISPYEWSFPLPPWLTSLREVTGKGPTELALLETSHIVHVLEQIICGYLCGSNDKKWSNQRPTDIITRDGVQVLRLHHPAEAFAVNLRGYISSLVPSRKCRMDVQTSDGREMVLRYVASHVSKWHGLYQNESLLQTRWSQSSRVQTSVMSEASGTRNVVGVDINKTIVDLQSKEKIAAAAIPIHG